MPERKLKIAEEAAIWKAVAAWVDAEGIAPVVLYLHGSRGTDWQRAESDWDFAVLCDQPLAWTQRMSLLDGISRALDGSTIDLADLRQCDTVFAAHLVSEGEAIYIGDEAARQRFEMLALAKYARLNEERHDILNDIRQRGTVYLATGQA